MTASGTMRTAAYFRARDALAATRDAAAAARAVMEAADAAWAATRPAVERAGALACRAGCAACCHQRVAVLPAEADAIAAHLRGTAAPIVARLQDRRDSPGPCPFLDDGGRCSVYAVRPLRCRGLHSRDAAACQKWPEGRTAAGPRAAFPPEPIALMDAALAGLGRALREAGHDTTTLDLADAVADRLAADRTMELPAKTPIFPA